MGSVVYKHANIALSLIGGIVVLKFMLVFVGGIWARLLRPGKDLKKAGKWAIVTGATDGIGYAMSEQFARNGLNVLLISRSKERLEEKSNLLREKYPKVTVNTIDIDFSKFDGTQRSRVSKMLESISSEGISTVVNNVGISYPFTQFFHEIDDERVEQLISINIER